LLESRRMAFLSSAVCLDLTALRNVWPNRDPSTTFVPLFAQDDRVIDLVRGRGSPAPLRPAGHALYAFVIGGVVCYINV